MTLLRKNAFIRQVKDITVGSTLALALLGNTFLLQSCGDSEDEADYEEVETYTKGVKTYISETAKGEFKITNEEEVPADSSIAIVTYLDGKQDKLSPQAVKALIDNDIQTNPTSIGQHNNLSNALLFGGMGYLLGKTVSPNYYFYRPDLKASNFSNNSDTARRNHYRRTYFGSYGRFYSSPRVFDNSSAVHQNIASSRTVATRPVGGRSGFFSGSARPSFRG